ncbi:MAG: neutral/alkaline non-lysosomal ceramidase N-terminal domain-containing protein, partial [Phycisphaeraceae bacterium]
MTDQPSALHIGIASIDITPPVGTVMVGYTARRSVRVAQPLRADALVCKGPDGTTPWALITCDTIGYTHAYARRIREAIAAATAIPASAIVLAGTHTHSGPCTIAFGRGESLQAPDHRYLESLPGKLVALVQRALEHAAPGSFEVAQTAAPGIGHNRRVQHADGTWGNQWQDPDGKHTGYYDPTILLAAVRRPNGRREALLVNFGCHPVVLGPRSLELSGDYVTYLR